MEQLNRALRLHQMLLEHRHPVSRSLILEKLECSASTFKRLLDLLRDSYQAPIVWDPVARGYRYNTADGRFALPGVWLSESEASLRPTDGQPVIAGCAARFAATRHGTAAGAHW